MTRAGRSEMTTKAGTSFRMSDIRICLCSRHHQDDRGEGGATTIDGVRCENVESQYFMSAKNIESRTTVSHREDGGWLCSI